MPANAGIQKIFSANRHGSRAHLRDQPPCPRIPMAAEATFLNLFFPRTAMAAEAAFQDHFSAIRLPGERRDPVSISQEPGPAYLKRLTRFTLAGVSLPRGYSDPGGSLLDSGLRRSDGANENGPGLDSVNHTYRRPEGRNTCRRTEVACAINPHVRDPSWQPRPSSRTLYSAIRLPGERRDPASISL